MQNIIPHLWYDKEAREAAEFYTSLHPDSKVTFVRTLHGPMGAFDVVSFELAGQPFMAISAGPLFKFNPSISFILNFDPSRDKNAREHLDRTWEKLSAGGTVLMPLDEYPFSQHYGWVQDKYGLSWQLILTNPEGEARPFITPSFMFAGPVYGKAEEAIGFYSKVFKNSVRGTTARYPEGMEPHQAGTIMFADFRIADTWLAAMDAAGQHDFAFNEAISLLIPCKDQKEIDYYWEKLSAVPEAEQCGWCKDKFGVSWQVTPAVMNAMLQDKDEKRVARVIEAFMPMKKFDLARLEAAYEGKVK